MKKCKKQVEKFRKEFKIKCVPDMSELRQIIISFHYQLLTYEGNEELLQKLGQYERSKYVPSFCCTKNRQNYLFYSAEIHHCDLPFVFAHEIGHIYMNHLNREENIHDTPEYKDREANEFASTLLTENKQSFSIKLPLVAMILSLALFIGSLTLKNVSEFITPANTNIIESDKTTTTENTYQNTETETADDAISVTSSPQITNIPTEHTDSAIIKADEPQITVPSSNKTAHLPVTPETSETAPSEPSQTSSEVSDTIVVTRTGKRYHKQTCWHLKNREGLRELSSEQAIQERYTPCADCF